MKIASPNDTTPATAEAIAFREWTEGSGIDADLTLANLQVLPLEESLHALLGHRLERYGAHSKQYVTKPVRELLDRFEPVLECGWWCFGLNPLDNYRSSLEWGCFKSSNPRLSDRGKVIKYEHPHKVDTGTFWLKVPASVAARIAKRFGLALPDDVAVDIDGSLGAFWRWWQRELKLPVIITEGAKKASKLLSEGFPAVAVAGIYNGARSASGGGHKLHPHFETEAFKGRQVSILFDYSDNPKGQRNIQIATCRLAGLLEKHGAIPSVAILQGEEKGIDDHLVAGKTFEEIPCFAWPNYRRFLIRQQNSIGRSPDQFSRSRYLSEDCSIPKGCRLIGLKAPMGIGKTALVEQTIKEAIASNQKGVLIGHRIQLLKANAKRCDLAYGESSDKQSIVSTIDRAHPLSKLKFKGRDWEGSIAFFDEITQQLDALLNSTTEVSKHRPSVMRELADLKNCSAQNIYADALLDRETIELLEALTGERMHLIASAVQPAEGRRALEYRSPESFLNSIIKAIKNKKRLFITTASQKVSSKFSAQNLAKLIEKHWPKEEGKEEKSLRLLVVDSETVKDPNHPASLFADNPTNAALTYDVVISTPAIGTGVSIDLKDRFDAVYSYSAGFIPVEDFIQQTGRLRSDCDRHYYVPERSPENALKVGNGATNPEDLIRGADKATQSIIGALVSADFSLESNSQSAWLRYWAKQSAKRNRQRLAYRDWAGAYLEAEGYTIATVEDDQPSDVAVKELKAIKEDNMATHDAEVAAAEIIPQKVASDLEKAEQLTKRQRQQLQAHKLRERYGQPLTAELVAEDREGLYGRLRLLYWLTVGRDKLTERDRTVAAKLSYEGLVWSPDLLRTTYVNKVRALELLGIKDWLSRTEPFYPDDPQLQKLEKIAKECRQDLAQVLGLTFSPSASGRTILNQLLGLIGYQVTSKQVRRGGQKVSRYEIVQNPCPVCISAVFAYWLNPESSPKISLIDPYKEISSQKNKAAQDPPKDPPQTEKEAEQMALLVGVE